MITLRRWWYDHPGYRVLVYVGAVLVVWVPLTVLAVVGLYRAGR